MGSMTDRNRVAKIVNAILNGGSGSLDAWPTGLKIRLLTANGSNTSNGTEATAGNCPGYTAGGVTITFGASSAGVSSSSDVPSWTASGSWTTVTGCEVWDIAGTPLRWLQGALSASITGVANGDTVQFGSGAVTADASAW
jgi:hypothetical protein